MMMANKIIIADNIIGSCSHIQESNKYSNKKDTTIVASTSFRENLIPQPYVDSQKISHSSTGIGSNTKTTPDTR